MVKGKGKFSNWSPCVCLNSFPATSWFCDTEQIIQPLCASIPSHVKSEYKSEISPVVVILRALNKRICVKCLTPCLAHNKHSISVGSCYY